MTKRALVTGVGGQDGSFLSEILLEKGYVVTGLTRRTSVGNLDRVKHLLDNPNFNIIYGDVTDIASIMNAIEEVYPHEFYNLAAQSFVGESWNQPILTSNSVGIGTLNCLEAVRRVKKDTRFYQASSSEMFGKVQQSPQTEKTPFYPRSPYAVAKVFGHNMAINYRESYGMFVSCGILFNHESPRRGIEFVTRKITNAVAQIYNNTVDSDYKIPLGNLDSFRDWGHARDYMEAAWMMLQHDVPDDFVIATGETHSIKDLLQVAFEHIHSDWRDHVVQDIRFMRPADVEVLLGDASKAKNVLGWSPKTSFKYLVQEMVDSDIKLTRSPNGNF